MKKLMMFLMAALVALALVGCGTNKNNTKIDDGKDNNAVEDGVTNDNNVGNDNNGDNNNNGDSRIDVAEEAANKVAELDEVDSATVLVTDNNAYVAVVLNNNDNTNTTDDNNNNDNNANNTNNDNNDNNNVDNNANAEDELSKDLEDKIAEQVREVTPDVNNVYVSLSPDFVERMNDYRTRINEGEPVEGFFEEFGEAVRNVFPDAR